MRAGLGRVQGCPFAWRHWLAISAVALAGSLSAGALPDKGTPAPPLHFTQLLQASPGAVADWSALRGKVVVLDFWATWCLGCVAGISHLNEVAASLGPAKFQVIYVDDEDPAVVQSFLAKRRAHGMGNVDGWFGIDSTSTVFSRYGMTERGLSVVVDPGGVVVAATDPEFLTPSNLQEVAMGRGAEFKQVCGESQMKIASARASKSLFEASLTRAAPNEKSWMKTGRGGIEIHAESPEFLLRYAYGLDKGGLLGKDRLALQNPLPGGLYDLRVSLPGSADSARASIAEIAVASGLHLRVEQKSVNRNAYILKATSAGNKSLSPAASNTTSRWGYGRGRLSVVNGSMDDLASSLEEGLGAPVVNETGFSGKFDLEIEFAAMDGDGAKAALAKVLGLELLQEDRSVTVLEVSSDEEKITASGLEPPSTQRQKK